MSQKFWVLNFFAFLPWFQRAFIFLRLSSCPFIELISYIPKEGKLLDVGTGFGLLPLLLVKSQRQRQILGIDPDEDRVAQARKASRKFIGLKFQAKIIDQLPTNERFSNITVVDVLYLLPEKEKKKLIRAARRLLKPHGLIFVKINNRSFSPNYFLTWLQEIMTVHLLRETTTNFTGLYFENAEEVGQMLEGGGFQVKKTIKLKTPLPFFHQHWLVIGQKKN